VPQNQNKYERMKTQTLLMFLLISMMHSVAQNPDMKLLQQELKDHPQADTFRVNRLVRLSGLGAVPPQQVDSILDEAVAISRKINYTEGEVRALVNKAYKTSRGGNKAAAFTIAEQALGLADKIKNAELSAIALMAMGQAKAQTTENRQALSYYLKAAIVAKDITNKRLLSNIQRVTAGHYANSLSDLPKAMEWLLTSLRTAESINCLACMAVSWVDLAALYTQMNDQENSLTYYQKAMDAYKQLKDTTAERGLWNNIGERYRVLGKYPEAIKAYQEGISLSKNPYSIEMMESNLADVYVKTGDLPMAFRYAFASLEKAKKLNDTEGVAWIEGILSRAYLKINKPDSALYFAQSGLVAATQTGTLEFMRDNYSALADAYVAKKDYENAYKFQNLYITHRDSMLNSQITNHNNLLQYNYNLQKKEAEITTLNEQKKSQRFLLIGAFAVLGLIVITAIVLLRNNRQKQHAYDLLSKQKAIIEDQRDQTNKALDELQLTQTQLVQSEKMASLGELTAGIAHEIQNPLNFVNNFSEINKELLQEMKEEIDKGNLQGVTSLANAIIENEQKVHHHSKRAETIVKGMLQHSRTSSGTKEPTDLNKLADEYLRLAYHGLRAKDKSFNATLKTNFDEKIVSIDIIPQDLGRVILNLITNAFYAVTEKLKIARATGNRVYEPTVTVSTKKAGNCVEICVADNGAGIPKKIINKIFQPFFTTKPAGQGTGLGLSMSYDIVKQGHNGELKTETIENEGTVFTIILPI
jgi:two-component system NtrC family sensor kinase